ncbi:complex I subunit 5 family protein [Nesterenkonia muleiensis]|uniref:complex I subunit 5 family protein n=1 Tax=Nesterenkonia muleiensis TaxID=2282648 RepID=UPI000E707115|nr:proton-conducting transporter membrane subunit [Nesterenkonia muleiensis]
MTAAELSLGAVVLAPLLAAALAAALPHTARRALGVGIAALVLLLTGLLAVQTVAGEVTELALGGYPAPLGIHLRADGLSVLFLGMTALVGAVVTVFAAASRHTHQAFWTLWLGCWAGLNAVFVSGDLFNTYVGLELVGLTAVALVALGGRGSWAPALRYLFIAVLGSLLLLVGVGLIVSVTGTLDVVQAAEVLAGRPDAAPAALLALTLITVGLCMKLALLPMHAWLVPAHASAPSAVSPLLSGLVIKAALFVLLRCWLWLTDSSGALSALAPLAWGLGAFGAAAVLIGSVMALRQSALKPLAAYSTVAQVGYWFVAFPLLLEEDAAEGAFIGIVALALGHGIAKAGLFLGAGYLKEAYGTDEIEQLRGAGRQHPYAVMGMSLGLVGLIGLPISLGFTGKWNIATAAVAAEHWWILVLLAAGTLLSAGYAVRALAPLLLQESPTPGEARISRNYRSVPGLCVIGLGALTLVTGFGGVLIAEALEVGAPW